MSSSSMSIDEVKLYGERGVPSKCVCGLGVTIFTSETQENQGRPFFRCASKRDVKSWTSKKDTHLFKWVEDAVYEEVEDALPRLAIIGNEINKAKLEVNELNAMLRELKEEEMLSKKEIHKCKMFLKVCFMWLCFLTTVLGYVWSRQGNEKKLLLGY
ncbi:uncharacterized protein At1g43920, Chloroplastic-like [Capsella rubella]|uniref:uncharacterized protein At1g43920, Chloroplastic-like n=1 Tax=Capsella rubella TaxID=81985 RepID=UPI000CD56A7B|nr:uncharacterized protein At1g43920, Chloroplastic-like [Capsella rubella]